MTTKTVTVPNISCSHCVRTIEMEVGAMGGVLDVSAEEATKQVTVEWDAPADWQKISALLDEIGYPASGG